MASRKRLTDVAVRNLRPKATRYEVPDHGARGLYVIVQPSGRVGYAVRYRHAGVPRKLTLQAGVTLAAARKLCAAALHELAEGRDPAVTKKETKKKRAAAAADTVQAICESYLKREGKDLRTVADRAAALEHLVYPVIGAVPITALKRRQVAALLDKIQDANGDRTADLVLAYLRKALNWWQTRDEDFVSPIVKGMGRYKAKDRERKRVLTDDELRTIWAKTETGEPFHALVRFLLLTGCRRNEAGDLAFDEINGTTWTLPASRNKTKVELVRPLSKTAAAIVDAQPRIGNSWRVFTYGGARMAFGARKKAFAETCGIADWRLHDLRRTARTLMSRAGVDADVAERCLGHVIGGVRGVYDRHTFEDEMRLAFEKLAALIERIVNPADNVRSLRRQEG